MGPSARVDDLVGSTRCPIAVSMHAIARFAVAYVLVRSGRTLAATTLRVIRLDPRDCDPCRLPRRASLRCEPRRERLSKSSFPLPCNRRARSPRAMLLTFRTRHSGGNFMLIKRWFRAAVVTLAAVVTRGSRILDLSRLASAADRRRRAAHRSFGQLKLNLLILGYQADEVTTDTIIFAHLDVARRIATLVSIPRDTWVPVPGEGFAKINSAYAFGGAHATARVVAQAPGRRADRRDRGAAARGRRGDRRCDGRSWTSNVDETMDYDDNSGGLHIHLQKGRAASDRKPGRGIRSLSPRCVFGFRPREAAAAGAQAHARSAERTAELGEAAAAFCKLARKQINTTLTNRQLLALLTVYRNVPDDNVRSFTLPSKAGWVGDASVVFADPRWAKLIGAVLFAGHDPPQDEVLVANATGNVKIDGTIVGALRGAGWNVPTFIDASIKRKASSSARLRQPLSLAKTFAAALRPGTKTALVIGADLAPDTE